MVSVFALAHQGVQKLRQIKYMFEEYLKLKCEEEGGFDGVLDDDQEDAYIRWWESKDTVDIMEYAKEALNTPDLKKKLMPF